MKTNQDVARAAEHVEIASKVYGDYIKEMWGKEGPIDWLELEGLAKRANDAKNKLRELEAEYATQMDE